MMNSPGNEPLPDDINDLPPARQRHIRRQPRSASEAEKQILLESLGRLTRPTLAFFFRSLLGAIVTGTAFYFEEPVVLIAAILIFPFLGPIFRLALFPNDHKIRDGFNALLSLVILFVITFISGTLAGWLNKTPALMVILERFATPYWLDLAVVAASTVLGVLILVQNGKLPELISVLLAFEILIPIASAGFSFPLGLAQLFPSALLVSMVHLGLALTAAMITLLWLGFPPKRWLGKLLFAASFIITIVAYALSAPVHPLWEDTVGQPGPDSMFKTPPSQTAMAEIIPSKTSTATRIPSTLTPTITTRPSQTASPPLTLTPTTEPTTFWANINPQEGVVIRETPEFGSPVISYASYLNLVEILQETRSNDGTLWYQVRTEGGDTGWLASVLVSTLTPQPLED